MNKYYDMNTAAEEAGKDAMPTPCEMFNKMQGLQHDYDMLLMRYTRKCKERDDVMRTLDQTTVKLNDETARADALQRHCDDLEKSRQAWVMKAMAFGRRGHWIEDGDFQICSECGDEHGWQDYRASYCENCGAKMDAI